jgi:hypothetical protein
LPHTPQREKKGERNKKQRNIKVGKIVHQRWT